jgi:hypothetical protein
MKKLKQATAYLGSRKSVKYAWIAKNRSHFSRFFYRWPNKAESLIEKESQALSEHIKSIFEEQLRLCSTRTIKRALRRLGYQVNRRRIGGLMKRADFAVKARRSLKPQQIQSIISLLAQTGGIESLR